MWVANLNYWQELNTHPTHIQQVSVSLQCLCRSGPPRWTANIYSEYIYFGSLILSVYHWLTFLQAHYLAIFLGAYFKSNNSGPISIIKSIFSSKKQILRSSFIFFTGQLNLFLPLWLFFYLSWCQQRYSSAWRIPSGSSAEMMILRKCLKNLSNYMLRVERGRRRRQTFIDWEMSKMVFRWLRISRQSFVSLLSIIISVSFIVSICTQHV